MIEWLNSLNFNILWSIVSTIFAVLALVLALYSKRKSSRLQHQLTQMHNEVRAINSGVLGMGRMVKKFAKDIANVEISHISDNQAQSIDKTYQQAGLLLSRGATIDEVVKACDMSPAEVELLAILRHSGKAA